MRKDKGITLVVLIITIIVMLILVAVSVNVLIKSDLMGIAEKTTDKYKTAAQEESKGGTIEINGKKYGSIEDYREDNEQYDPNGWVMAWTCADGGNWSDTIEEGGTAEGDIVAKLYKTGNKITPGNLNFAGNTYTFKEGDEYNLVIEGKGTMGDLAIIENGNPKQAMGWQKSEFMYYLGQSDTCVCPYINKIIIGEGIKNLGIGAISNCTSLTKINLPQSLETIKDYSFQNCNSLEEIIIPKNVKKIGEFVFYNTNIKQIIIKILATDVSIGNKAFYNSNSNLKIYVLNDIMKTRVEAESNASTTTVEVVTEEQMKSL